MTQTWHTDTEIAAQPAVWRAWADSLQSLAEETRHWISSRRPDEIWLCGAGTSAFIGDVLAASVNGKIDGITVRSVPTTDIVSRPTDFLTGLRPLVISFGRSGNSSESVGTLNILDKYCPQADRLSITCNGDSALSKPRESVSGEQKVIVLPAECHDKGFAMTSSFTTMLLTALACLSDEAIGNITIRLNELADGAELALAFSPSHSKPSRVVFLGSGPFTGIARESALKVLELTAGDVVTSWDSTLGFRHGPKAIVDANTSVYVYLSSDDLTRKYDQDIVTEIRAQYPEIQVFSIGESLENAPPADIEIKGSGSDIWNAALYVLIAQLMSVAWAKELSLNVDNPFTGGNLTRVVANVRLYN